jgi:hypothetical protein
LNSGVRALISLQLQQQKSATKKAQPFGCAFAFDLDELLRRVGARAHVAGGRDLFDPTRGCEHATGMAAHRACGLVRLRQIGST